MQKLKKYNELVVENNSNYLELLNASDITEQLITRSQILKNIDEVLEAHIRTCYDDVFHEMLNVYYNNGGSIRRLYMNNGKIVESINEMHFAQFLKDDALNENLIVKALNEKFENNYLDKLFEADADPNVPSEEDLGLEGDTEYEDVKDEQPSTWQKFKNTVKRAVDYGLMKAKEIGDFIKNGIKQLAEGVVDLVKEGALEMFKSVEKPVKGIIKKLEDALDKDPDKKKSMHSAHKSEHAKDESRWYKEIWYDGLLSILEHFATQVQAGLTNAIKFFQKEDEKAAKEGKEYKFDLAEFQRLYGLGMQTVSAIEEEIISELNPEFEYASIEDLNENEHAGEEPITLKSFTNILKDQDKSWYEKFKALVEQLNTLVLHLTKGMVKLFAELAEKMKGPKAAEQYPVSGATAKLMIEQLTPLGAITPNNLGAGKILIAAGKKVLKVAAGAFLPPGVKTAVTVSLYTAKYLIVLNHFMHEAGFGHH